MTKLCDIRLTIGALCAMLMCAGASAAPPATAPASSRLSAAEYGQIDRAVQSAVSLLQSRINTDGKSADEYPPANIRHGGKTASCVYAMLACGLDARDETVKRAIGWLSQAQLKGTYAVAMRALCMAELADKESLAILEKDVTWLVKAAARDGSYTYESLGGKESADYDNSNAQLAVMAVWMGSRRGVEVPGEYWKRVERHWTSQQQGDGGFGYFVPRGDVRAKTYGSMTAAGLATLHICRDMLQREDFVLCAGSPDTKRLDDALGWLATNYRPDENPRLGPNWYYYWLFCLERVALAGGHKYVGASDWYADGARELVRSQNRDGSWGAGDVLPQTAMAAVFLARGRQNLLLSKLAYKGKWNARPRDAANLAAWFGRTFERPVNWQVLDADAPLEEWHDAPILYISGASPPEFTPQQEDKLRMFALRGGMIVSESACNNVAFTMDMQRLYGRLFGRQGRQLPDDHDIYGAHFQVQPAGLWGVSNGVRLLAVHAPRELSLGLQLGGISGTAGAAAMELAANICQFATDAGNCRPRGEPCWPDLPGGSRKTSVNLARVAHGGNCDPEPLAWKRLAVELARHDMTLEVSDLIPPDKLDAAKWPIASIVGTDDVRLTDDELEGLRKYLAAGGKLLAEAAGGSKAFAAVIEKQIVPLAPGRIGPIAAAHPVYNRPCDARKVTYRRQFALSLGDEKNLPRLKAVTAKSSEMCMIVSADDLTSGLLGSQVHKLHGYSIESSRALVTNVLWYWTTPSPADEP